MLSCGEFACLSVGQQLSLVNLIRASTVSAHPAIRSPLSFPACLPCAFYYTADYHLRKATAPFWMKNLLCQPYGRRQIIKLTQIPDFHKLSYFWGVCTEISFNPGLAISICKYTHYNRCKCVCLPLIIINDSAEVKIYLSLSLSLPAVM